MAQPQNNVSITAPGFAGLNTQDSPLDMDQSFASVADNCVIDNYGRISSRRGFQYVTENPEILVGDPIVSMGEFINEVDGVTTLFACGHGAIYIQNLGVPDLKLVAMTLPNAVTNNNWQMAQMNNKFFFVQSGEQPLVFDPVVSMVALAEWSEYPVNMGIDGPPNAVHAAFGRLWVGDFDSNSTVVAWSGLLNGEDWTQNGTGSLQTSEYWPSGYDSVTAMAAHNDFMMVFGLSNILIYSTSSDVQSTIRLVDTIEGIGCIARDSIAPTGSDIMFMDATGVRSLMRTIQEKSVPIGDISKNVRTEFQTALSFEPNRDIKSVYHVEDSFYAAFLPSNPKTYVFDTWSPLQDGSARASVWVSLSIRCGERTRDRETYFGGTGGVFQYQGASDVYLDPADDVTVITQAIPMTYFTHPLDFGSPSNLIFPKQVDVTLIGGLSGFLNIRWGFDYKDADKEKAKALQNQSMSALWGPNDPPTELWAEWSDPENFPGSVGKLGYWTGEQQTINQLKYNIWGSGRNVKIGFATDILGSAVSIQELNIQVLQGRIL
jgi:hypothetical protein